MTEHQMNSFLAQDGSNDNSEDMVTSHRHFLNLEEVYRLEETVNECFLAQSYLLAK